VKPATNVVSEARSEADQARRDVIATVQILRRRLDPRNIAAEAAENTVVRTTSLLVQAGNSVKRRRWLIIGGAAALAVAVGFRLWVARSKQHSDAT